MTFGYELAFLKLTFYEFWNLFLVSVSAVFPKLRSLCYQILEKPTRTTRGSLPSTHTPLQMYWHFSGYNKLRRESEYIKNINNQTKMKTKFKKIYT